MFGVGMGVHDGRDEMAGIVSAIGIKGTNRSADQWTRGKMKVERKETLKSASIIPA